MEYPEPQWHAFQKRHWWHAVRGHWHISVQLSSHSLSCVQLFAIPWTLACQASLSFTISWSFLKLMSIELVMPSIYLILCHPLLLLPSIFPSIKVFFEWIGSRHQVAKLLEIQHQFFQWIFKIDFLEDWLIFQSNGLGRVFSNTPVPKHQFFSAQPSLCSNSHSHTWLLEKS